LTRELDHDLLLSHDAASPDATRAPRASCQQGCLVITGPSTDKAAALLALHSGPGFVLPNAWDAGSARILEQVGFPAIATTSAGVAWSCGVPDGRALDRDAMLDHVARIVAAVECRCSCATLARWLSSTA
jgi:hypothetical protein